MSQRIATVRVLCVCVCCVRACVCVYVRVCVYVCVCRVQVRVCNLERLPYKEQRKWALMKAVYYGKLL